MPLPIADRNLNAVPPTHAEMVELLEDYRDNLAADPIAVKFATGLTKYLSDRPVLSQGVASAAGTRFDRLGV